MSNGSGSLLVVRVDAGNSDVRMGPPPSMSGRSEPRFIGLSVLLGSGLTMWGGDAGFPGCLSSTGAGRPEAAVFIENLSWIFANIRGGKNSPVSFSEFTNVGGRGGDGCLAGRRLLEPGNTEERFLLSSRRDEVGCEVRMASL